MKKLTAELSEQMKEGEKLDEEIKKNLGSIGFKANSNNSEGQNDRS